MSGPALEKTLPLRYVSAAPRHRLADRLRGDPQHGGKRSAGAADPLGPGEGEADGKRGHGGKSTKSTLPPSTSAATAGPPSLCPAFGRISCALTGTSASSYLSSAIRLVIRYQTIIFSIH